MKKFDFISGGLIVGMVAVMLLLFREWDTYQSQIVTQTQPAVSVATTAEPFAHEVPELSSATTPVQPDAPVQSDISTSLIHFSNDVLDLQIDPLGGDIVGAKLLEQLDSIDGEPIVLLENDSFRTYVAQSGLVGANGTDTAEGRPLFVASRNDLTLAAGEDQVVLDLQYIQQDLLITKRFTLNRGDYYLSVDYLIDNQSAETWTAAFYAQLKRDDDIPASDSAMGKKAFVGAAITTPEKRYQKFTFKDLQQSSFKETVPTGWAAILQNYFLAAWLPDRGLSLEYNLRQSSSSALYYVGFTQAPIEVAAGGQGAINAGIYLGPKDQYRLKELAEHLDLTVDYGWVWWAAQPLYAILYFLHNGELHMFGTESKIFGGVSNWGICIILLTIIVKSIFFKLSEASYKSMARMRKLQPKLAALKERYGDDKQQFSQEMMRLYQKEKINPLGGCLPIMVQMPVFIALYWVLRESVELRHEPFYGWIVDLSAKDPWFILPLIMGGSMFIQMRLNPAPPDPTQAKVMQMMPFMFTFMFMWFPAGLVLYWCSNNILSIAQQWLITRSIEKADTKAS